MVLFKLRTSCSFRCLQKQQELLRDHLGQVGRSPVNNTILNWVLKVGHHALARPKDKAKDWVIILDTSIQMGQEKVLVILGVRQVDLARLDRPLAFTDLTPLVIAVRQSWTGDDVHRELAKLQEAVGTMIYAVADHGSELRKGLRLAGIKHVHDLTHAIAIQVKNLYDDDPRYKSFCARTSRMGAKFAQSGLAEIVPPAKRKKSPYQNVRPAIEWATKMLAFLAGPQARLPKYRKAVKALRWLQGYTELIDEMRELVDVIASMETTLKHGGLRARTARHCEKLLAGLEKPTFGPFKDKLGQWLRDTLEMMPPNQKTLCSSDIIESIFGAYKNFVSNNKMAGVTRLVLVMAALTCDLTLESTKESIEAHTVKQVKQWASDNIGETLNQRRREMSNAA